MGGRHIGPVTFASFYDSLYETNSHVTSADISYIVLNVSNCFYLYSLLAFVPFVLWVNAAAVCVMLCNELC